MAPTTHVINNLSLPLTQIKKRLLKLSPNEASFSRRGFPGLRSESRRHLEGVIHTFIEGYNIALGESDMVQLSNRLDAAFSPALIGFAYEGAGLYFGLSDLFVGRSESRLAAFTRSAAQQHDFITMVGAGFAIARVPFGLRRFESYQRTLDPMTAWCLADGHGFHQGYFHWKRFIERRQAAPASFNLQNRRLFDAGVGRSMWWVFGADPVPIANAISRFDTDRQGELWAGIGTAIAYAGGGTSGVATRLLDLAGPLGSDLLSGIPFAAHMRHKGMNPAEWTDEICWKLLHRSVGQTSGIIRAELREYLDSWQGPKQEKWDNCYVALRDRVKRHLEHGPDRQVDYLF
jgi:enediyne biosynthesis protein E3